MELEEATAGELAEYDQRLAQSKADLKMLTKIWLNTGLDLPEHYRVVGFIQALNDNVETEALGELLAIAVKTLAQSKSL